VKNDREVRNAIFDAIVQLCENLGAIGEDAHQCARSIRRIQRQLNDLDDAIQAGVARPNNVIPFRGGNGNVQHAE
jgi:hypothetical protein